MKYLLFLLPVIIFSSCGIIPSHSGKNFELGQSFDLKYFQFKRSAAGDLEIFFKDVYDSRCPKGVNCVRAGEARFVFDLTMGNFKEDLVLEYKGLCEEKSESCGETKQWKGYSFHLLKVNLYPSFHNSIPKEDYEVYLVVAK